MRLIPLLTILMSFASPAVLLSGGAAAQDAPPVSEPGAGQASPVPQPAITPGVLGAPIPTEPASAVTPATASPVVTLSTEPEVVPIPAVWAPVPKTAAGNSAYGLYLAGRNLVGRASEGDDDAVVGARALSEAESLTPEQPTVREQAFTAALLAGNLDDAVRIAPSGLGVPAVISEAGKLVSAVQTFARGDARRASAVLKAQPIGSPHQIAALLVQPWIAAAARDWDFALASPDAALTGSLAQIRRFQRAQLLEIHNRDAEAEAQFRELAVSPLAQPGFPLGYGAFLERRRKWVEAVAVYDAALAGNAGNAALTAARTRAVARGRPPSPPSLKEGAQSALILAASQASDIGATEFATVYLRLALNVLPSDDVRLLLGATLSKARLEAASRAALAEVLANDPRAYASARVQIGMSLNRDERKDEALAEFRKAAAAQPDAPEVAYSLAAQLIDLKRYDEALTVLNGPLLSGATQPAELHYIRGAAYEATGKIAEAEAELQAALKQQPDEPVFLNYLGYLWVDNGTRVAEGAAMIDRAHAAKPEDGNIQDSLGWAQYRQGQFDTAVTTLEGAVSKEPANAEINDHLGDAYWQVGRKREAGYQWNRVLTLDPDAERRASVEKKLAEGLTAPETVSGTQ